MAEVSASVNPQTIRLLLLDTNPAGMKGSMSRYGNLLESSLGSISGNTNIQVTRLHLALPNAFLRAVPRVLRSWVHHAWIKLTTRFRVRSHRADVVHVLDGSHAYLVNGLGSLSVITTSHDVIPLKQLNGDFELDKPGKLVGRLIQASIRGLVTSSRVVAVSHSTRRDLVELTLLEDDRITVVHNALDPLNLCEALNKKVANDYILGSGKPFIFHIGNEASYKNRQGVLRIFAKVCNECDVRLLLAGPAPSPVVQAQIRDLRLDCLVDFIENPEDEMISACYDSAELLLFPSLYEGFGWPPLEAMAHDCPVVCSSAASLPEVVGDAALLGPVEDERQLADHCISILRDPSLAESLIQKGRQRIKLFSVEKMAEELTAVYLEVVGDQPHTAGVASEGG